MKREKLLTLLREYQNGNISMEDLVSEIENSKNRLTWVEHLGDFEEGYLYKVYNGKIYKLPLRKDNKELKLYYRKIEK